MSISGAVRLFCVLLAVSLSASSGHGYIHFPPMTLQKMCRTSTHIRVLSVSKYDKDKDVVRAPMQTGVLGSAVNPPKFAFSQAGPKQCNLRLYAGETGSFLDISEK